MKTCNSCYHCIEISDTEEHYFICGLHNLECAENGCCGLYEGGDCDRQGISGARGQNRKDYIEI